MVQYANLKDEDGVLSKESFRYMVLNTIRKNVSLHRKDFGSNVVIACDSGKSWRYDYFRHYKANRKKGREESTLDWKFIFECISDLKAELKEYFPYRVIEVERAEADDVIGSIAYKLGVQMGNGSEKILIVSGDKDFMQLQKFSNVYQFDAINKRGWLKTPNAEAFLIEHIIKGDGSDGIPNALSPDTTLVDDSIRSTVLSAKRKEQLTKEVLAGTCEAVGYHRNKTLIDLSYTPAEITINIMSSYEEQAAKPRNKIMNYFIKFRLTRLIESMADF